MVADAARPACPPRRALSLGAPTDCRAGQAVGPQPSHPIAHWAALPYRSTWSRLVAQAVDVTALETCLGAFVRAQLSSEIPARGSVALVVDGKTLRGTIPLG